jgi:hypothetical protein
VRTARNCGRAGEESAHCHCDSVAPTHAAQVKAELPEAVAARQRAAAEAAAAERAVVVHEKNEWQIEVVPAVPADAGPGAAAAAGSGGVQQLNALPEGLSFSHVRKDDIQMLPAEAAESIPPTCRLSYNPRIAQE